MWTTKSVEDVCRFPALSSNNVIYKAYKMIKWMMFQLFTIFLMLLVVFGATIGAPARAFILIDPWCSYLSGNCKARADDLGIRVFDAVSPYIAQLMTRQGMDQVPSALLIPDQGSDSIRAWVRQLEQDNDCLIERVISESDSGLEAAEAVELALGLEGNGDGRHFRFKHVMNERLCAAGLPTARQSIVQNVEEAEMFLDVLWGGVGEGCSKHSCIVKPCRGVGSEDVHLCTSHQAVKGVVSSLLGTPRYGGGRNDEVLLQEYLEGAEYAVDTVTRNGHIKVVAVWRYEKRPVNGAPFVYQGTQLVTRDDDHDAIRAVNFTLRALVGLSHTFGAAHTEVIITEDGPRLIEVNTRWHAADFTRICSRCYGEGHHAVSYTVDAICGGEAWHHVPSVPPKASGAARLIHLVSLKHGTLVHIDAACLAEVEALPSCVSVSIFYDSGDEVQRTVNIKTDFGAVYLWHEDEKQVEADYQHIVNTLQHRLLVLS